VLIAAAAFCSNGAIPTAASAASGLLKRAAANAD